jgi:hypothetical protein
MEGLGEWVKLGNVDALFACFGDEKRSSNSNMVT